MVSAAVLTTLFIFLNLNVCHFTFLIPDFYLFFQPVTKKIIYDIVELVFIVN
jgi:hypothetical protein